MKETFLIRERLMLYMMTCMGLVLLLCASCSPTRFISEDEFMLSSVGLSSTNKHVKSSDYRSYVAQEANSKWFNLLKVPLGMYCMSGTDSTKRFNKFMHRIGEAPIVYDTTYVVQTKKSLSLALQNKGYLHAKVEADVLRNNRKKNVVYTMDPGRISYVTAIRYECDDKEIERVLKEKLHETKLYKGMPLSVQILNDERNRVIQSLQNKGYYNINREFLSYKVDTLAGDYGVELTLSLLCPPGVIKEKAYTSYKLREVRVFEDVTPNDSCQLANYKNLSFLHQERMRISPRVYSNHIYVRPDSLYSNVKTQNTYGTLNALSAINYCTIHFSEVENDSASLDCDILVKRNKPHTISTELEGTNTAGNLGAALSLTYSNLNIFGGSENFSLKLRGAYEAITGLEGYSNQNYLEYSVESNLRFPALLFPFAFNSHKQFLKATSEIGVMYNSQDRPEFHRRMLTAAWTYRWSHNRNPRLQHRMDLLSLNYIFMPWISDTFKKEYLENTDSRNSILRYSYEDLFIMRLGYSFVYNSQRIGSAMGLYQKNGYQIKFNIETAGNLLYGMSKLFNASKNSQGQYNVFNIAYSQYAKIDFDYSKSFLINDRNSVAIHTAFGLALPYGNSSIVPYEKRYFSGGANSVRGWNARGLGPGKYVGKDGKVDFINQTGNLKLDLSLEYRTRLFWKIHGAFFIDAGNVWNTRKYEGLEDGQFKFDKFYKQIAVAYGLGLRVNLDYFILRIDGGMKAINPGVEKGRLHYPLICPNWKRDFTFHFAVGLPF